jgi:deazaflavin-dependent oxidoreductase (nitroreductase family)
VIPDRFYARFSMGLSTNTFRFMGKLNRPIYRLSGGRIGGRVGKAPVLLVTTTGRRSGQQRTSPVVYLRDGENVVIINTNAGHERVPAWSLNLKADPRAEVEIGSRTLPVVARIAEGEEREDLWRRHNVQYSGFDEYKENIERRPEVFVLEPAADRAAAV